MNTWLKRLTKWVDLFASALAYLSALSVAAILVLVSANFFSRNAGGHGVSGLVEYGEILVVLVVFLPLAYAQLKKEHIAVDIITSKMGSRARNRYESILALILAVFCLWIAAMTTGPGIAAIVDQEFRFGLVSVPLWPAKSAIPIGFLAFGLKYLVDALLGFMRTFESQDSPLATRGA